MSKHLHTGVALTTGVIGLFLGIAFSGIWPETPLHAVATHGHETCAIATGRLDDQVEAVYFLDFLTGNLRAAALNVQSGKFGSIYEHNVLADLQLSGEIKNPRFLLVTGLADLRRGPVRFKPSGSTVYVMEANSGALAAYTLPYNPGGQATGVPAAGRLFLLDRLKFRNTTAIVQ